MLWKSIAIVVAHDVVQSRMTPEGKTVYSLSCWSKPNRDDTYIHFNLYFSGGRFDGILKHIRKGTKLIAIGTSRINVYLKKDGSYGTTVRIFVDSIDFAPSSYSKSDSCEDDAFSPMEGTIEAPPAFEDDGTAPF